MQDIEIRPYVVSDQIQVMAVLDANIPQYFAPEEREEFVKYLSEEREDYFVVQYNNQVVGAGGVNYFPDTATARISWDFLLPQCQGKGLGGQLLQHRVQHIRSQPQYKTIIVRTSQHAFRFYQKGGFAVQTVEKDYWAPGFDLYLMKMAL